MISGWVIILISALYLALLFFVADRVDRDKIPARFKVGNRWIYALAIPVYCTAWTYYGSVGKAVNDGWEFLTIYLGPILTLPIWWFVVRKIIRICEVQRISTLADFISTRFDKSMTLSIMTSSLIVVGIIPYISIQLKSISNAYEFLVQQEVSEISRGFIWNDAALYLSILLGVFIVFFVFKSIETTDKHKGMMTAIALDSIVKLVAFMAVGIFVTFYLFDGFRDVFSKADADYLSTLSTIDNNSGYEWFFLLLLSMSAILLLPRQFQVMVAENQKEGHLKSAMWLFPIYLLLINIFVVPIAIGGLNLLPAGTNPDTFVLALPLLTGQEGLALLTFVGGFSAATGMIIVSTISLSLMLSNNVIVPILVKRVRSDISSRLPILARRGAVFIIFLLAYLYYRYIADAFPLVSIGLISFAAMIQFAPTVLSALYWKDANKKGVIWGLSAGFILWAYTLVIPTAVQVGLMPESLLTEGPLGINWLKPEALFGLSMSSIAHGTFWSLLFNVIFFFIGTLVGKQAASERNLAELYVNIFKKGAKGRQDIVWKGELELHDLMRVCENLLGKHRMDQALADYKTVYGPNVNESGQVTSEFVAYNERLLTGAVGAASARLLIASISREEEIVLKDVMGMLKETTETVRLNKELRLKSQELERKTFALQKANSRLLNMDKEKDDFISTVTHELRTPLTSIKAFVEILQDNPDLDSNDKHRFFQTIDDEIERMTRLINQVLDMEKLDSGATTIVKKQVIPHQIVEDSLASMQHLLKTKNIELLKDFPQTTRETIINGDTDRLKQVFINLFSNAVKYSKEEGAKIEVKSEFNGNELVIAIKDNGKGIHPENIDRIFEKFFQARDQTSKKPKGSGLGLSITKKIVELHDGDIFVESTWQEGSIFTVKFPISGTKSKKEPVL
ncbi:sensor histidine kinase [Roseivirga misakiensis]|uniref:sensor histidine kinase n=1 Tax=Roseivirga misakiensis TaxID=1563681 RepID=UPI000A5FF38B|nr:sensor histidine kinase [Roseivirga misakiensis]